MVHCGDLAKPLRPQIGPLIISDLIFELRQKEGFRLEKAVLLGENRHCVVLRDMFGQCDVWPRWAGLMLRLHWHIFIVHFLLRRKVASVNGHFLTHFPRRDVCAEKLTCQLLHSGNASV